MASPWGYQAPQMPGLDVQQPFAPNGQRKVPRPLAAPGKRNEPKENSSNDPWNLGFNLESSVTQPNFPSQTSRPPSGSFGNQHMNPQQSPIQEMSALQFPTGSSSGSFGQMSMGGLQPQPSMSPDNMFNLGSTNGDPNSATSQMDSMQLFGNALMDQFDFSDLGLGNGVQSNNVETSFNPFALAQSQSQADDGCVFPSTHSNLADEVAGTPRACRMMTRRSSSITS